MDWAALVLTLPFVAVLLYSGAWADRRYRRFDKLPGHFDFHGKATRMTPRRTMAWLLPVIFSLSLIAVALIAALAPPEMRNGEAWPGVLVGGAALVAGQAFVLWLTERWARRQG